MSNTTTAQPTLAKIDLFTKQPGDVTSVEAIAYVSKFDDDLDCMYFYTPKKSKKKDKKKLPDVVVFSEKFPLAGELYQRTLRLIEIVHLSQFRNQPTPPNKLYTGIKAGKIVETQCIIDGTAKDDIANLNGVYLTPPPTNHHTLMLSGGIP